MTTHPIYRIDIGSIRSQRAYDSWKAYPVIDVPAVMVASESLAEREAASAHSHAKCLREFLKTDKSYGIVIEDDAILCAIGWLAIEGYDLFMPFSNHRSREEGFDLRIREGVIPKYGSQAYVVSRRYAEAYAFNLEFGVAADLCNLEATMDLEQPRIGSYASNAVVHDLDAPSLISEERRLRMNREVTPEQTKGIWMDAILFVHHLPINEAVTRKHLALLRALNQDAKVIPLSFGQNAPESPAEQRHGHDLLMWRWFAETNPHYERYFLIEYDTFCTQSLRDFFGDSYHKKVVGSTIIRPWSDEIVETDVDGCAEQQRYWWWFTQNKSPELYPFLRGIVPASVVMMSHEAMFNMSQLMLTVPAFKTLQCECRLGTLAGWLASNLRRYDRTASDSSPAKMWTLTKGQIFITGAVYEIRRAISWTVDSTREAWL